MLLAYKSAQKKIDSGKLKVLCSWEIPETMMLAHFDKRRKASYTEALTAALIMPVIFFLIGLFNLLAYQDFAFFITMIKFGAFFFILFYPISYWSEWRKARLIRNADKVLFGENWFLFGKIFNKWNKLNHFQGCTISEEDNLRTLDISTRGIGRGQTRQTIKIPIPENSYLEAEKLLNRYNNNQP